MQIQFYDNFSVFARMWLCSLLDLVPAKENPNLGRLELRLLFFASFYFFLSVHERAIRSRLPCGKRVRWSSGGGA
jgi:hypothetical protein